MAAVLGAALLGWGCSGDSPTEQPPVDPGEIELALELVTDQLDAPVHMSAGPGDGRLFAVEQPGRVRIIRADGSLDPTPFLDVTARVRCCGERGLLSIAFHPDYAATGWFFVTYTDADQSTRVERYSVSADPDVADRDSDELVIAVEQPFSNHNGGLSAFGPDGMLYVALGDGGSQGDPDDNGQDLGTLLGTLLRIDVNGALPYEIPADNPFLGTPGARSEIWAYGLRNPWRFSFDFTTEELFVGDVGQNQWEEVNRVDASAGGLNYGWNVMEGPNCRQSGCDTSGLTLPATAYRHSEGCSVIGGHVYRGSEIDALQGHYFFSDLCGRWLRSMAPDSEVTDWGVEVPGSVTSFGQDSEGEVYVLTIEGGLYRIVAE